MIQVPLPTIKAPSAPRSPRHIPGTTPLVAIALMEMAVSIVCEDRSHQSGGWSGGHSGLGGGQALWPINTRQTHKSSSTELLPGPFPTSTAAKSFLSRKALIHHSMDLAQATASESSGNPSLASDQLSGLRQVTSLSKPQFLPPQNRVPASALAPSYAQVAQGQVPKNGTVTIARGL